MGDETRVAWVRTVAPDAAEGYVKNVYGAVLKTRGYIPNVMRIFTTRPDQMRAQNTWFRTMMYGPSGVSRAQREMIATLVSVLNRCHF